MKLHRYVDHQRLHIVTKDVISLSISVLLLFRHYISHKITFGAPSSGGVLCSACGAFIYVSVIVQIPVLFYHGTPEERANLRHKIRKLHAVTKDVSMRPVVITSYEMTMRDRSALKDIEWRYLIVDEGHRIKNWQCKLVR